MSSAGLSGTSDTDRTKTPGGDAMHNRGTTPENAETNETLNDINEFGEGEPVGMVEIVEIETTGSGLDALGLEPTTSRFRWWYVPAAALPIAAGATAGAIWLLRRNNQPVGPYQRLVKQGRSLLTQARSRRNARQATKAWQQGIASVRETAKGLPDQASVLRDRSAEALAAIDLAAMLEQTRDIWGNAMDQMSSLWERNTPAMKKATKRANKRSRKARKALRGQAAQMGQRLADLRGSYTAAAAKNIAAMRAVNPSDMAIDLQNRINRWLVQQRAQQALATARGKAVAPIASAARTTSKNMQKTGKSVNRGIRRARAFSFGLLVTAMLTYIRVWRARLDEREMRETAGGRMVRDPNGPVEAGALLP